ncbi:hypothetical protein ACOSQ2_018397 [Xanthoceras sorbifolium]
MFPVPTPPGLWFVSLAPDPRSLRRSPPPLVDLHADGRQTLQFFTPSVTKRCWFAVQTSTNLRWVSLEF